MKCELTSGFSSRASQMQTASSPSCQEQATLIGPCPFCKNKTEIQSTLQRWSSLSRRVYAHQSLCLSACLPQPWGHSVQTVCGAAEQWRASPQPLFQAYQLDTNCSRLVFVHWAEQIKNDYEAEGWQKKKDTGWHRRYIRKLLKQQISSTEGVQVIIHNSSLMQRKLLR